MSVAEMLPYIIFGIMGIALVAQIREWLKPKSIVINLDEVLQSAVLGDNVVPFIKATREQRQMVMEVQGYRCANPYCNMNLRDSTPHWDHIIPRVKGGTDSVHNMQWLCETCNLNKRDKDWLFFLFEYATRLGMDPNINHEPWVRWIMTRHNAGLGVKVSA